MAEWLQNRERVKLVICVSLVVTGCFYLDPVNRKPEIHGVNCQIVNSDRPCVQGQTGHVHRGDLLRLDADFNDPEGHEAESTFNWKAFQCTGREGSMCFTTAYSERTSAVAEIEVPSNLSGVSAISVKLEVRDDRGASQEYSPKFLINDAPTLEVRPSAHSYVVDAPIELFAKYGDPDDGPDGVALTWGVVAPGPLAATLDDLVVPSDFTDPEHTTAGKLLVPGSVGNWDIQVRAADMMGETVEKHLTFAVGPDQPPCLAQAQPLVPPDGASLPVAEPTLFQVPLVDDDLDPYPPLSGDPHFGTTTFEWSILPPGSPGRQLLMGATGNTVDFDPGAFTPGEIVELRVEIFDRKHTAIPCADDVATCSVNAGSGCVQRQTWRVEVR